MEKNKKKIVLLVGLGTFFFGFGAPAILNLYLLVIKSPLVLDFRSSLNFVSAIFGDGIILPVVNTLVALFIINNKKYVNKFSLISGVIIGLLITFYFHVTQAVKGLINWSMPTPWHWNLLGLWHFLYMLTVTSLLGSYLVILFKKIRKEKTIPKSAYWVIGGIIVFLILLKLDYTNISLLK